MQYICEVSASIEEDRPQIDFSATSNKDLDWSLLNAILADKANSSGYRPIYITIDNAAATNWDFYLVPGTLGLISRRAVDIIGASALKAFELLPGGINDTEFYFLKAISALDCFDLERSVFETFKSDPTRLKRVSKYVFLKDKIPVNALFTIPQSSRLFATSSLRTKILGGGLNGWRFTLLDYA